MQVGSGCRCLWQIGHSRLNLLALYATMQDYEGRNRTVPRRVSSPLGLVRIGGLFLRPYGRENPPDRFPDDCGRDARKH